MRMCRDWWGKVTLICLNGSDHVCALLRPAHVCVCVCYGVEAFDSGFPWKLMKEKVACERWSSLYFRACPRWDGQIPRRLRSNRPTSAHRPRLGLCVHEVQSRCYILEGLPPVSGGEMISACNHKSHSWEISAFQSFQEAAHVLFLSGRQREGQSVWASDSTANPQIKVFPLAYFHAGVNTRIHERYANESALLFRPAICVPQLFWSITTWTD